MGTRHRSFATASIIKPIAVFGGKVFCVQVRDVIHGEDGWGRPAVVRVVELEDVQDGDGKRYHKGEITGYVVPDGHVMNNGQIVGEVIPATIVADVFGQYAGFSKIMALLSAEMEKVQPCCFRVVLQ